MHIAVIGPINVMNPINVILDLPMIELKDVLKDTEDYLIQYEYSEDYVESEKDYVIKPYSPVENLLDKRKRLKGLYLYKYIYN